MNQELLNLILARRSVRRYDAAKPVEESALETLCRAALAAPSARNQQLRELVVVTKRETLDTLGAVLPNAPMLKDAGAALVVCGVPARLMPMALLTIGVPLDGTERAKDKWKPEKIHREKF